MQVPTAQLEQRIKEELEINPALEEGETNEDELTVETIEDSTPDEPEAEIPQTIGLNEEPLEELLPADDVDMREYYDGDDENAADYRTNDTNDYNDPDNDIVSTPTAVSSSFHEYLESQIGLMDLDEKQQLIVQHLIGSLDDDGYLRRGLDAIVDDLVFRQNIITDEPELQQLLKELQKLDPVGVGARSLDECLLIQLYRKEDKTEYTSLAIKVLENHFDLFAKRHYPKLETALNINSGKLKKVLEEITKLNPKPGSGFGYSGTSNVQFTIIPDFLISSNNGELQVSLTSTNAPELRISTHFKEMITNYQGSKDKSKSQKEAILFIKQKIDSAQWFIEAIQSRYQTMLMVMNTIADIQYNYLSTGDETNIKPMILKDIAARTGLDASTVSRVTSSKYVQTEFGTIPLKFFFNESLTNEDGDEVGTREIKRIISNLIEKEDKSAPIGDQEITEILKAKGYLLARRTVAKYRETLGFAVSRMRREL